jgi:hypothetical protein
MNIAVHISFSEPNDHPTKNFNYRCFSVMAEKQPEHRFFFIFDKPFDISLITQKNITPVLLSPVIRNRLLEYYWYNFKIPALLNKINATVFISNAVNCCIRTSVRQCMILQDLSFLQKQKSVDQRDSRYIKKFFKKFVEKTSCIAVSNQHTGLELKKMFPAAIGKSHVIGCGLNDAVKTTDHLEKQQIKIRFAEGKEYFIGLITDVSVTNTTVLLKAFSAFKKRQHSNMQLLLALTCTQKENPVPDFANYKYRNEVKLITAENDQIMSELTSAAYAAIYLPARDITEDIGLMAIKNNSPLITVGNEFCKSLYNDAALYVKTEEKNIAEKMMLIYKNENLREDMVNMGKLVGSYYSWDQTSANLWQVLQSLPEQ